LETPNIHLRLELQDRSEAKDALMYILSAGVHGHHAQIMRGGTVVASIDSSIEIDQLAIFQNLAGQTIQTDLAAGEGMERVGLQLVFGEIEVGRMSVWMSRTRLVTWLNKSTELASVFWAVEELVAKENKIRGVSGMSGAFLDAQLKSQR